MNIPFAYPIGDFPFKHSFGRIANTDYFDAVTTSAVTQVISTDAYETRLTTSGTEDAELISIANGTIIGERKLLILKTLGESADSVTLAHANVVNASGTAATGVTFDAANEFLLIEWNGTKWQAIYTTATITTA